MEVWTPPDLYSPAVLDEYKRIVTTSFDSWCGDWLVDLLEVPVVTLQVAADAERDLDASIGLDLVQVDRGYQLRVPTGAASSFASLLGVLRSDEEPGAIAREWPVAFVKRALTEFVCGLVGLHRSGLECTVEFVDQLSESLTDRSGLVVCYETGGHTWRLNLGMQLASVLLSSSQTVLFRGDTDSVTRRDEALRGTQLALSCRFEDVELTLSELANLKVGDLIDLETDSAVMASVHIESVAGSYVANLGACNGKRAVKIESSL